KGTRRERNRNVLGEVTTEGVAVVRGVQQVTGDDLPEREVVGLHNRNANRFQDMALNLVAGGSDVRAVDQHLVLDQRREFSGLDGQKNVVGLGIDILLLHLAEQVHDGGVQEGGVQMVVRAVQDDLRPAVVTRQGLGAFAAGSHAVRGSG